MPGQRLIERPEPERLSRDISLPEPPETPLSRSSSRQLRSPGPRRRPSAWPAGLALRQLFVSRALASRHCRIDTSFTHLVLLLFQEVMILGRYISRCLGASPHYFARHASSCRRPPIRRRRQVSTRAIIAAIFIRFYACFDYFDYFHLFSFWPLMYSPAFSISAFSLSHYATGRGEVTPRFSDDDTI